ncbi:hypothetical protein HPDFL43_15652 [Hoeflea phototrophica DFL-43]|uniref:Uncharacterized protein n=2 Tax=Hoeflea TaxID=274591 RepID=A9D1J3_HOEPD|nr:hypothetical protein HPDFL43_15652 [Hoeflea phototrophica DFL-43]
MHMRRTAVLMLTVMLLGMAPALLATQTATPASAQERVERKSILQLLFGRKNTVRQETRRTSRVKRTQRRAEPAAVPAPAQDIEKLENARKILVLGDFIAGGAADGLREAFAEAPGVVVVDRSNGSSGLVRDDYYDWLGEAPAILAEIQPSIIVVQLGSNDRQQLVVDGESEAVRSPKWLIEYERRTREFITRLRAANAPLLWVGLPAFQSAAMTSDIVALNGIFRKQVALAGGEFIDIWDGFVDESGKFIFTGSDINGQQVRLRGSDGINVTRAGRRKIAFYIEKPARRLLGDAASVNVTTLGTQNLPEIFMPPAPGDTPAAIMRTRPVAMTDPDLDGGSALLGEMPATASLVRSPRDQLVIDGMLSDAPEGRADNFAWPRSEP